MTQEILFSIALSIMVSITRLNLQIVVNSLPSTPSHKDEKYSQTHPKPNANNGIIHQKDFIYNEKYIFRALV